MRLIRRTGVNPRPLGKQDDPQKHQGRDDERRDRAAQSKAAVIMGFVEDVADRRSKRPCENESRPKQQHPGNLRPDVGRPQQRQADTKKSGSAQVAGSRVVRHPVAKRRAERMREDDRRPVNGSGPGKISRAAERRCAPPRD